MFKILFAVVLTVFSLPISWYYHDSAIVSVKSRRTCVLHQNYYMGAMGRAL